MDSFSLFGRSRAIKSVPVLAVVLLSVGLDARVRLEQAVLSPGELGALAHAHVRVVGDAALELLLDSGRVVLGGGERGVLSWRTGRACVRRRRRLRAEKKGPADDRLLRRLAHLLRVQLVVGDKARGQRQAGKQQFLHE